MEPTAAAPSLYAKKERLDVRHFLALHSIFRVVTKIRFGIQLRIHSGSTPKEHDRQTCTYQGCIPVKRKG